MKCFILAMSLTACHSPGKLDGTANGSAVAGQATSHADPVQPATQDAPRTGVAPVAYPAAQPNRPKANAARWSEVQTSLKEAIEGAKRAKTLKSACSGMGQLAKAIDALQFMDPPAGFERQFNEQRGGLVTEIDVIQSQDCADGSGMDADTIKTGLEGLQKDLLKLQQIGRSP